MNSIVTIRLSLGFLSAYFIFFILTRGIRKGTRRKVEKASNRAHWNLSRDSRRVYRESGEMNGRGEGRSTLDETRLKERMREDGRRGVNDNVPAPGGAFGFPIEERW